MTCRTSVGDSVENDDPLRISLIFVVIVLVAALRQSAEQAAPGGQRLVAVVRAAAQVFFVLQHIDFLGARARRKGRSTHRTIERG